MVDAQSPGVRWPAIWALTGVGSLLSFAAFRLAKRGLDVIGSGLTKWQWLALVALTALFLATEGAGALQRRWVPRVVGRARALRAEPRRTLWLLAPLHAMALIAAPRAELTRAWITTTAIVIAVLIVSTFPQPWRGIVDFAVACGLLWGVGAIVAQARRALH